jgi:Permuted papain-like amidase enzyme, YaeF/YiiX, C92 family
MFRWIGRKLGRRLAQFLNQPRLQYDRFSVTDPSQLEALLRPGDVLLVEGDRRISTAIKYVTQSSWSHSCIFIGDALKQESSAEKRVLIEADLVEGVIAVPLSKYASFNTRICRPVSLTAKDTDRIIAFLLSRLGHKYDLKNVFDLARYFLPLPPVPSRYRRRLLALGSGDPTKAICSTLLAQAFQLIGYPILPRCELPPTDSAEPLSEEDILHRCHYTYFTPRDFDLSPYFAVVKPPLEGSFDYKQLNLQGENTPTNRNNRGVN